MKWSKYNYMFSSGDNAYFLYNSLTNSFIEMDAEAFGQIQEIRKNLDGFDFSQYPGLEENLKDAKVLTENDLDEYYQIKLTKHLKRFDRKGMSLTIAPTMHCNFNCSYCYEASRPPVYMTGDVEDKLVDFVKQFTDCRTLSVTWYGGEALLAFDRIERLSHRFMELDLHYNAHLLTNGYCMDKEKVDRFKELKIGRVHLTIDGPEEIHNQRRPHIKHKNSFAVVRDNLDYLMEKREEFSIYIVIRVNIDRTNEDGYSELYRYLHQRYPGHPMTIYPGFVKEHYGSCNSAPDDLLDRQMQADFTLRQFKKHGIPGLNFFPELSNQECMARHINSYLVDPTGNLYKCWTDIGVKEKAVGNITKKGGLNNKILTRYLTGADPFDEPECQECFYVPICTGRCPHFALKKKFDNADIDLCTISKGNLKEFLHYHYHTKKLRREK